MALGVYVFYPICVFGPYMYGLVIYAYTLYLLYMDNPYAYRL